MSVEYLHNIQYVGCIALSAHDRSTSLRKWALLKMWVCDYAARQKVVYITTAPFPPPTPTPPPLSSASRTALGYGGRAGGAVRNPAP